MYEYVLYINIFKGNENIFIFAKYEIIHSFNFIYL